MNETLYFINWHRKGHARDEGVHLDTQAGITLRDARKRLAFQHGIKLREVVIYDYRVIR